MSQRGTNLGRIRRLFGGGVPTAGVTRVSRRSGRVSTMDSPMSAETGIAQPPRIDEGQGVQARQAEAREEQAPHTEEGGQPPRAEHRSGQARPAEAREEPSPHTEDEGEVRGPGGGDVATTAVESLGAGDSHGLSRTGEGFGSYRGVHRKAAA